MTTVLLTRPREDSESVARELDARGLSVAIEPLLDIVPVEAEVDAEGVQGILATSANGVRALARVLADRSLPVWAVGDASARTARELGYTQVESASGDVDALADLVKSRCKPEDGAFLHAAGSVTAGDLSGRLAEAGFTVRRMVLYEARTATELSPDLMAKVKAGGIDAVLFFSPRTAATFVTLATQANLAEATGRIAAYALSPAVATALGALSWARLRTAAAPTQAALLAALDEDLGQAAPQRTTMTESDPTRPPAETKPAEQPETTPEQEAELAAHEAKGTPWKLIAAAVALVVAIIGGVLVWEEGRIPAAKAPATASVAQAPDEVENLKAELAANRERIRALEARLSQQPQGADLTPIENRLGQTEAAVKALQSQPQVPAKLVDEVDALSKQVVELKRTAADAAAVLRLADRVEKAESVLREMQGRRSSAAAVLLAVGQLREALANAMPYDSEWRSLKALAGNDAEVASALEILKPSAVTGIPTLPMLTARLANQAPAIVRAQVLPEQQSWWRQTLDRLASLVTIEREDGNAAGSSPAAIIARAQGALADGDLARAITELEGLTGGPAEQAAPWIADAKARLAAGKAVSELTAHVVASVGAGQ
ncbi:MAG TPA: uroporphyrinogen-III synthase [Magnetospirillum sp.]|nr:uroporphyrinogen-III synthase [Magnetospirillum sp.]